MSTDPRGLDDATAPGPTGSTGQETPIYDELVAELGSPGEAADPTAG